MSLIAVCTDPGTGHTWRNVTVAASGPVWLPNLPGMLYVTTEQGQGMYVPEAWVAWVPAPNTYHLTAAAVAVGVLTTDPDDPTSGAAALAVWCALVGTDDTTVALAIAKRLMSSDDPITASETP